MCPTPDKISLVDIAHSYHESVSFSLSALKACIAMDWPGDAVISLCTLTSPLTCVVCPSCTPITTEF